MLTPELGRALRVSAGPGGQALTLCSVFVAYWRFWLCVSVVYELFLIFILFQVSALLAAVATVLRDDVAAPAPALSARRPRRLCT